MTDNTKNYCTAKFTCRAKNPAEQATCKYFHPSVVIKHENCVAFIPGAQRSCICQKARGDALDRLIEWVKGEAA
jgi:hypothetical protein